MTQITISQPIRLSHAEAAANAIIGLIISQLILWAWGLPLSQATALNIAFLLVSYLRAYVIRRAFERAMRRHD